MNSKKAFTLIEVILALVLASIISAYVFNAMIHNNFNRDIVKLQNKIYSIINDGIISTKGYASGLGGDCSANLDFSNLTVQRLADCNDWNSLDLRIDNNVLIGLDLMDNYGACKIDVAVVNGVNNQFDVFVDCSDLEIAPRKLVQVEDSISFTLQNTLSSIFINIEENAVALDTATISSGDNEDGMVRARFEL